MAAEPKQTGVVGERVLKNLRRLRRGVSTTELSRRLDEIGWPIRANGITRIEGGNRRVDADDLVALAIALGTTPNRLLMPGYPQRYGDSRDIVPVVGNVRADAGELWAWACGEVPLLTFGGIRAPGVDEAVFAIENQPHHHVIRKGEPPLTT